MAAPFTYEQEEFLVLYSCQAADTDNFPPAILLGKLHSPHFNLSFINNRWHWMFYLWRRWFINHMIFFIVELCFLLLLFGGGGGRFFCRVGLRWFLFVCLFWDRMGPWLSWNLLCGLGWPPIHRDPPSSTSPVPGLKVCTTPSALSFSFKNYLNIL